MKRAITVLLALALIAGAGFAQAGRGGSGGGRGGGGGHAGSGGHPGMGGGHFGGAPGAGHMHFVGGHPPGGHPIWGGRPPVWHGHPPGVVVRPPIAGVPPHRVIVGGAIVVGGPYFWYPPYPYPYYPYVVPSYGSDYTQAAPTYIEQGQIYYYCPDYQDYYPNVPNCPSPWVQVAPGTDGYTN